MHFVPRVGVPLSLRHIKRRYTQRWVDFYSHGRGKKPSDRKWTNYLSELRRCFHNLCGYCEATCRGEVDHFRPKSKAPHLVYAWDNWVFACHDCNHMKGEKWPNFGYIDPCAVKPSQRPEAFFQFDLNLCEIVPMPTLKDRHKARAAQMIEDLDLNAYHHLKRRLHHLLNILEALDGNNPADAQHNKYRRRILSKKAPLCSFARCILNSHKRGLSPSGGDTAKQGLRRLRN